MRIIWTLVGTFVFSLIFTPQAGAYLDPGSGSYILQILLASVFGALYLLKVYWQRIIHWIKGLFVSTKNCEDG